MKQSVFLACVVWSNGLKNVEKKYEYIYILKFYIKIKYFDVKVNLIFTFALEKLFIYFVENLNKLSLSRFFGLNFQFKFLIIIQFSINA